MLYEEYSTSGFKDYEDFDKNYTIKIPENFNFAYDVVDRLAREQPNKRAMVWCNPEGDERTFTFEEMSKLSNQCANMLKANGIKKGDMVMLILKRHYEFWITLLALHKIGAVAIPATHLLTKKDIVYRDNAAGIKMIIATSDGELKEHVEAAMDESPTVQTLILTRQKRDGWLEYWEEMAKYPDTWQRPIGEENTQNDDMLLLYFTSGTTGMPKMVTHNQLYPLGHISTAIHMQNVTPDGLHLTVADTGWGKTAWGKIYGQWLGETCLFVYDMGKFVPSELLQKVADYHVTTFCAPPTIYRYFIKEDLSKYDLSALRYVTIAGEPLNPEVFKQFKELTGLQLMEMFGQTETISMVGNFRGMTPKPGSMGRPNPDWDVDVVDENGESCPPGVSGELVVRTDKRVPAGLFTGYYTDDELMQEMWHDDIYHTGDVVWKDEDGYYWYVGRADDVIKSSGYRIGPFEVESALIEHPAVLETAITGVPHPERGTVVKATIVLAPGYEPSEELKKELQDHVKRTTAPYKYPRVIEFVDEDHLPKTISGKIRRVQIREEDRARQQGTLKETGGVPEGSAESGHSE